MSSGRHILAGKKGGGLAGRGQRLDFVFFQGFPGKGVGKKKKKEKWEENASLGRAFFG